MLMKNSTSPSTVNAIAAFADLLASTLNANLTAWRSAPAAVELERLTIDWIKQIIGYHPGAAGLFVSGGSMANMSALAVARRSKAPTKSQTMCVYCSQETHHSIEKAAALLGIGQDSVRKVAVDENLRIRIDDLVAKISEDIEKGNQPFCVVATQRQDDFGKGLKHPLEIDWLVRQFTL